MTFFVICGALALFVVATLVMPMVRRGDDDAAASEVDLYRAQLDELGRDVERGTIGPEEAERAHTEIARRLLAADRAGAEAANAAPAGLSRGVAAVVAVAVLALGGGLYAWLGAVGPTGPYPDIPRAARLAASAEMRDTRPSQAELVAAAGNGAEVPAESLPADYADMVQQLRDIVPTRPDELQGWELLARHEAALGRYAAAAEAQRRVIALRGEDTTLEDRVRLLDLMVAATSGIVSPEAERLATLILAAEEDNLAGLYYVGLLYAQTDRPDVAFRLWRQVVESGSDAQHVALARGQIAQTAFRAGVDYTLPPERGPSAADIEAAGDMDPEARAAMIEGMVSRLSERLASEGGTSAEWAQLIGALAVLGETERARAILGEARQVFAERDADLERIDAAAERAGLP